MSKNRKITTQEFEYLTQLPPYATKSNEDRYKNIKNSLLTSIEGVFADRWFNLKLKTREAIEYITFLSIERGFLYASPAHISEKYGIAKSTVYDALKQLRNEGILVKANRCSKKQNGLGCAMHFFTTHPYFGHINGYLNLQWKAEEKADRKAENAEIPCVASDSDDENDSTLSLPDIDLKDIDLHINVPESHSEKTHVVKYVPKEINALYAGIFDFRLRSIWQKVTQAFKTIKHQYDRADLLQAGIKVCRRIHQIWKEKERKSQEMTIDEMCAFAYKATRDMYFSDLANEYMQDFNAEDNIAVGDAIRAIPQLENIYVSTHSDWNEKAIIDHVMLCIELQNSDLSDSAMSMIRNNYKRYSEIMSSGYSVATMCS